MLDIIIPTYNKADYLKLTLLHLERAINGSPGIKVYIGDNSTNGLTKEVFEELSTSICFDLVYKKFDTHEGEIGKNIRRCVGLGQSKFVLLLGDDDVLSPGCVPYILSILQKKENLGLLFMNYLSGREINKAIPKLDNIGVFEDLSTSKEVTPMDYFPNISFMSSCVFSRIEYEKHFCINVEQYFGYEFLAPILMCAKNREFVVVHYPILIQRRLSNRPWNQLYPKYYFVGLPNVEEFLAKLFGVINRPKALFNKSVIKPILILAGYKNSREMCYPFIRMRYSCMSFILLRLVVRLIPSPIAKFILNYE